MIKALIVDDETPARLHVRQLLQRYADIKVVAEASNGLEALERISAHTPDVVFLDIEMPGLNGFEVLRELLTPPLTVFVTAYDEYAIRAFEANAIDYVLKPIQAARLDRTLDRVRERLARPSDTERAALRTTAAAMAGHVPAKLVGRRGNRLILLAPKEVLYAAIDSELVFLHTAADRFACDHTITQLEKSLGAMGFFRVSRSTLVNLHYARELLPDSSGTYRIKLSNGIEVEVSRERARDLKERLR